MCEQLREVRREPRGIVAVWRVAEDEIVSTPLFAERTHGVHLENRRLQAELVEVRADHPARVPVLLDERCARGAARERLEAHRTGAGEEVEHLGVVDGTDQVERALADAVGGRPRVASFRRGDPVAAMRAGDDPHAGRW